MRDARAELVEAALARWPQHQWGAGELHHGAFHLVLTAPEGPSLRATVGRGGRARSRREADTLLALETARFAFAVPQVLDGPYRSDLAETWITSMTTVAGEPTSDLSNCSEQRISAYEEVLTMLRAASLALRNSLPPVRAWCGGDRWPIIVQHDLIPRLDASLGVIATERVSALLEAEGRIATTLCHGDFGPHNILWSGERMASVIDFDHACIGDPAIDIAPLIGFHGAENVASLGTSEEIRRAMLHRATLPLQVAAAAHLAGLADLRDHALGNFERRAAERTLFDPNGETPD